MSLYNYYFLQIWLPRILRTAIGIWRTITESEDARCQIERWEQWQEQRIRRNRGY